MDGLSNMGLTVLYVAGLIAVIGALVITVTRSVLRRRSRLRNWPGTTAVVRACRSTRRPSRSRLTDAEITRKYHDLEFEVDGRRVVATTDGWDARFHSVGSTLPVRYDPTDPTRVEIATTGQSIMGWGLVVAVTLLTLAFLAFLAVPFLVPLLLS